MKKAKPCPDDNKGNDAKKHIHSRISKNRFIKM